MNDQVETASARVSHRARWSAIGAAVAVVLGAGGLMTATAINSTGERSVFVAITPCRVMDTRPAPQTVGPRSKPVGAAETHTIAITGTNGNCVIPGDASAVSLNVTVVNPTATSFLTVFPADAARPTASNLNYVAGQDPVPNAVTVDLSADGKISFFNNGGTADVLADIVGYYQDHNHDDRYYTKTETNAHEATQKYISVDIFQTSFTSDTENSIVVGTDRGSLGVSLTEDNEVPRVINFVVPPDITPNTNMTLQLTYLINQTDCTVSISPQVIFVNRPGTTSPTVPFAPNPLPGFVAVDGDPRPAPAPKGTTSVAFFTLGYPTDGSGLQAGDVVSVAIGRDGTADTCTARLILTGAQVVYS